MRILFIGNSHTYVNALPKIFCDICSEHNIDMVPTMLTQGGIGLDVHVADCETKFNVLYGKYDYIVMQHTAHPMWDLQKMHDAVRELVKWSKQAGSIPVLYQTWGQKGEEDFQSTMSGIYYSLGKEFDVKVAPVGDEWQKERIKNPSVELYAPDGSHASKAGSTLAANVIFNTIFGR